MRLRFALLTTIAMSGPVLAQNASTTSTTMPSTASPSTTAPASTPSLFDPTRHMKVSEVRAGMKGYGLTVLSGTKIDRFDVEVISVLHNAFGPQADVVMIRCLGEIMEHTGPIAGCSGSPIYLFDESGKARLIGAYAFGFDNAKDPIVGVQPIEYMLRLTKPPAGADDTGTSAVSMAGLGWSVLSASPWRASNLSGGSGSSNSATRSRVPLRWGRGLQPLSIPMSVSGASETTLWQLRPMFEGQGFVPLLAPGTAATADDSPAIEPGSVLGAAVMTGDLELTALGTCTEVIDGRVFAFGHPFNGEGATSIPMGAGTVNLVMPTNTSSFKIGGIAQASGAIDMDGSSGVAGQIGAIAATVPITVEVKNVEDAAPRTFHYHAALHRTITPTMVAAALQGSVVAEHQLPVEFTASYEVTLQFANGRELHLANKSTSLEGFDLARDAAWPISTAMDNPIGNVAVTAVSAKVELTRGVNAAEIEDAAVAQPVYRPGETARVNVRLRRYKGDATLRTIDIPLPAKLKDGDFIVTISDAATKLAEDAAVHPDRFVVRNVDELFKTLVTLTQDARNDALYARLGAIDEGIAIGRTTLAKLPPSRRAMLSASGRPDLAVLNESPVIAVPMDSVIRGTVDVTIHVKKKLP